MNTKAKLLKGARLLGDSEVVRAGDWGKWSQSHRDEWLQIPSSDTFRHGLPVATLRVRVGQSPLQFCTFSK